VMLTSSSTAWRSTAWRSSTRSSSARSRMRQCSTQHGLTRDSRGHNTAAQGTASITAGQCTVQLRVGYLCVCLTGCNGLLSFWAPAHWQAHLPAHTTSTPPPIQPLSPPPPPCPPPFRRRPFLVKGLEATLNKFILSLEFYDEDGRKKIAIGEA